MAALRDLPRSLRALIVGYPGAGKTGSLAALANAGFKLRILDFDGNYEPLQQFVTNPNADVDIITLEDVVTNSPDKKFMTTEGIPVAFNRALQAMKHWKSVDADGVETDLGKPADWGDDTIVVLDSLTAMGSAAMRRSMKMLNRTPLNNTQQVWGTAMADQEAFIELLTARTNRFHVIVLAHLKMVGPRDIVKDDDELTKDLKAAAAEMVKTRLYPSALGRELPPKIASHFGTVLLAESFTKLGQQPRRVLRWKAREDLDLKVPTLATKLEQDLPIEDGLLTVFKVLGANPPKSA